MSDQYFVPFASISFSTQAPATISCTLRITGMSFRLLLQVVMLFKWGLLCEKKHPSGRKPDGAFDPRPHTDLWCFSGFGVPPVSGIRRVVLLPCRLTWDRPHYHSAPGDSRSDGVASETHTTRHYYPVLSFTFSLRSTLCTRRRIYKSLGGRRWR